MDEKKLKSKYPGVKFYHPHLSNISMKAKIGKGTKIHPHTAIYDYVIIGKNCKIQSHCYLPPGVEIEDNVFVGPGVLFANDPSLEGFSDNFVPSKTIVRRGVKIGLGARINGGVNVGEYAVIGAGAVVLEDCDAHGTYVGVPARRIK